MRTLSGVVVSLLLAFAMLAPPSECPPSSECRSFRSEETSWISVHATGYTASEGETDSTPDITANGSSPFFGSVALSRDLLREFNPKAPFRMGQWVRIYGVGIFLINDTMDGRWVKRMDFFFEERDNAIDWGVRKVYIASL